MTKVDFRYRRFGYVVLNDSDIARSTAFATEVFGRPSTFDPQMDSTIRVQAGRLRSKLAEYYASEGIDDGPGAHN